MHKQKGLIAGVDEVGRGCLFGPVFAGAVVLSEDAKTLLLNAGLKDSKKLTPKKRAQLVPMIEDLALSWGLGQASSREIDLIGIRSATEKAMLRALQRIQLPIKIVHVDGILPLRIWEGEQITLKNGESASPAIAAASVLAKESRDNLLKRIAIQFPDYGFERHFGYGTQLHRNALFKLGITPLHRRSFLSKFVTEAESVF